MLSAIMLHIPPTNSRKRKQTTGKEKRVKKNAQHLMPDLLPSMGSCIIWWVFFVCCDQCCHLGQFFCVLHVISIVAKNSVYCCHYTFG